MRLIDADALKVAHGMKDDCADCDMELRGKSRSCEFDRIYSLMDFCGWLDDAPTIEPERKTGRLIHESAYNWYRCSVCKKVYSEALLQNFNECMYQPCFRYCPHCGAKMEEGEADG